MHHPPDSPHHHQHQHQRGWSPGGPRRRWLEPFLLVLLADGPAHGYSLLGRLNDAGVAPEDVDVGQLYRTLRELEVGGLVRSRWETPAAGAARREYEVAEAGLAALDDWAAVMRERARLVGEFLAAYEQLGGAVEPADSTREALP
jgi:DNA-binding PadR family transcriptional regulator